ncbi:MAG: cache and HAMP domain-containing protein [Sulfurifustis sp.]
MKSFFRFGIFQKLLVAMLVVALAPLCAIWYIDYLNADQQISARVSQQLGDTSEKLTAQVDGWVSMNLKALRQNATVADIVSMDARRQNPMLKSILQEYGWSYLVFTIGPTGANIGRSDDKPTVDYSDRIYFKQVMEGKPYGKQVVISRTTNRPALILSAPIVDEAKKVIGVIAMGAHLTDISEIITKLHIGSTGYAFLLDEEGKIIAHQKQEYVEQMADFSKHPAFLARPETGKKQVVYEDGGQKIIAYVQSTPQGWTMVTQQNYDEAYAPIREANRNALLLLALTLIVVSAIAYLLSRQLATPIRALTRIANEMSRGRVVPRMAEAERKDEIGDLARAIDRMGTSIRLAMDRLMPKKSA